jgi:hypothetical protein
MRTRAILIVLMASLLLAAEQPKDDADPKELEKLQKLLADREGEVLQAWLNSDVEPLRRLLADDYVQVGGPGPDRMTKEEVIKSLIDLRVSSYEVEDIRLLRLAPETALLTYRLRLKGSFKGNEFPPNPILVSSTWVRRSGQWLSVYRQLTLATPTEPGIEVITAFDALVTPDAVRYTYQGTAPLLDVEATFTFYFARGQVTWSQYWGTWQPGETKSLSLDFLADYPRAIERLDLSATATSAATNRQMHLSTILRK